jgi:uncharacterized protein GlcG (DUF336 family)
MMEYELARKILDGTRAAARERNFQPVAIVVLDDRGAIRAALSEDGTSTKRVEIAIGKAHGAIAMGIGSRDISKRAPHFLAAVTHAVGGMLVPVPGGVLVRDAGARIIGAVGVSGETSDNDEIAAIGGITAAGFAADGG